MQKFEKIIQKIDPTYRLIKTWQVKGGISAEITGLEIGLPDGATQKLIVRRHGDDDFKGNPQIAAHEFHLRQFLKTEDIPVAKPYYLDETDEILGRPYLVLEYIEGHTEFDPANLANFLLQFATNLAKIHCIHYSQSDFLAFLPERNDIYREFSGNYRTSPDEELMETRLRETLAQACPLIQVNPSSLLHGDYWLGNILWKDEELIAIIDWEDAMLGDPLADLAISRLEILWALGYEAMESFTTQYQVIMSEMDYSNLAYWDLWAALRPIANFSDWAEDAATRKLWRERHQLFSTQALEAITTI